MLEKHRKAVEQVENECPYDFRQTMGEFTNISGQLASLVGTCANDLQKLEKSYGDIVADLKHEKDQDQFACSHRDYVGKFEDRAFAYLRLREPKYKQALAAGVQPVSSRSELFKVLKAMKSAEEDDDEDTAALYLTDANRLLRVAWDEAIQAKGLTLDEYRALRIFKDRTNRIFHQSPPAQEALRLPKTSLPVPPEYAGYKEPLMKLLQLLTKPGP